MKPTLLTLSFLLFSFTYFPSAFTELVKDIDGNALFPGGKYYILPATDKYGAGGGVRLGETSNCPVPVLQDYSEDNGLPVHFNIRGPTRGFISIGDKLEIAFYKKTECNETSKWVIVADDFSQHWVGISSIDPFPGDFKIVKNEGLGYKLQYCPWFTISPGNCTYIGRQNDDYGRLLVLTQNEPYVVKFVHAAGANIRSVV